MPTSTPLGDEELRTLTMALGRICRSLRQRRETDLPWPLVSLLFTVARLESSSPQELARAEGIAPPSLTRTLHQLIKFGFVEKAEHPSDRRRALISLTATGETERQRLLCRRQAWVLNGLQGLGSVDAAALRAALPALERLAGSADYAVGTDRGGGGRAEAAQTAADPAPQPR